MPAWPVASVRRRIRRWTIRLRSRIRASINRRTAGSARASPRPSADGPGNRGRAGPPQCPPPATLGDLLFADGRKTPGDNRCGAFQKLSFVNTYLPRMGADGFGWYDVELTSVWGVPFPNERRPAGHHAGLCHALARRAGQPRHSRPTARRLHRVPLAAEDRRAVPGRRGRAAGLL